MKLFAFCAICVITMFTFFVTNAATAQYPANGGDFLRFNGSFAPFTWQAHEDAASFTVFLGPWPAVVGQATQENMHERVFAFDVIEPYLNAWHLEFVDGVAHYWRVDTHLYNGETIRGAVWNFYTANWCADKFAQRGRTLLTQVQDNLLRNDGGYWEDLSRSQAAFAWPISVALLANVAAAVVDYDVHIDDVNALVKFTELYWVYHDGIWGFDCVINPGIANRFYDDNAWLAWALVEAYTVTGDVTMLERARQAFAFVLTGASYDFGGGILWKETQFPPDPPPKMSVSSTSGAAMAAAMLYRATGESSYKEHALWFLQFLQTVMRGENGQGQIFNDITLDDHGVQVIGMCNWSYNTAVPVIAYMELYFATSNTEFLQHAQELAEVLIRYYHNTTTGALNCHGYFAFTIVDAFTRLYYATGDMRYLSVISRALSHIYHASSDDGFFHRSWSSTAGTPIANEMQLLINMPVVRAFFMAAAIAPVEVASDMPGPIIVLIVLLAFTFVPVTVVLIIALMVQRYKKLAKKRGVLNYGEK